MVSDACRATRLAGRAGLRPARRRHAIASAGLTVTLDYNKPDGLRDRRPRTLEHFRRWDIAAELRARILTGIGDAADLGWKLVGPELILATACGKSLVGSGNLELGRFHHGQTY